MILVFGMRVELFSLWRQVARWKRVPAVRINPKGKVKIVNYIHPDCLAPGLAKRRAN